MARAKPKSSKQARKRRGPALLRRGRASASRASRRGARNSATAETKSRRRKQSFVASHHRPEAFEQGLRRYAQYRDLGIAGATKGMVRAHVIKMVPPCDPAEVSKRHFHEVDFQMVYV